MRSLDPLAALALLVAGCQPQNKPQPPLVPLPRHPDLELNFDQFADKYFHRDYVKFQGYYAQHEVFKHRLKVLGESDRWWWGEYLWLTWAVYVRVPENIQAYRDDMVAAVRAKRAELGESLDRDDG